MRTLDTVQAQKMIAAVAIPPTLKQQLQVELRDAVRKGFRIDCEQLRTNLARLRSPAPRGGWGGSSPPAGGWDAAARGRPRSRT